LLQLNELVARTAQINVSFANIDVEEMAIANISTGLSKAHSTRRDVIEKDFFATLRLEPSLNVLAGLDARTGERLFYEQTKGDKAETKTQILNNCLKYFALTHLRKKDGNPYQPNSCNTTFKVLFAVFHSKGIIYSRTTDFNFKGGWCSFLAGYWAQQHSKDVTFGDRPTRPPVSDDFLEQFRNAVLVKKLIDITGSVLRDLQMLVYFLFGAQLLFRGVKVSHVSPFVFVRWKRSAYFVLNKFLTDLMSLTLLPFFMTGTPRS
jgi:hypothetical protein